MAGTIDLEFAGYTAMIKRIANMQLFLDKNFIKDYIELRKNLYTKKITGLKFWEQYKKALLKSVQGNREIVNSLLRKTDNEMKRRFKEAEKAERKEMKEEKPVIDLSLPE